LLFGQSFDQLRGSLFILVHEVIPSLAELDKLFLLFFFQAFQFSFMDEIQELFAPFVLILPDELNFLFGLFGLLIDWVLLAFFPIVIQKT
jgi:hypothetical protein